MNLEEGTNRLISLKTSAETFDVVKATGKELKNIVEEVIFTLREIDSDDEYWQGLEDDALAFEEFLDNDVKYFSNSDKGKGKKARLLNTRSLIAKDIELILFSLKIKMAEI